MKKIDLPEPVKVATAVRHYGVGAGWNIEEFEMKLGKQDVAIVLASQICLRWDGATPASFRCDALVLERTSTDDPSSTAASILMKESNRILDYTQIADEWTTAGAAYAFRAENFYNQYKVFPYPYVAIRAPQLAVYDNQGKLTGMSAMLWWVPQKVTDRELAELMVKHHA